MPTPILDAPLIGCVSIDATSPDGYLDNARAGTPDAGAHLDVQTAARNLMACAKASPGTAAWLIGHGDQGVIAVGSGRSPGDQDQHIGLDNVATWTPLLEPLKGQVSALYLLGSAVGSGEDGAELLHLLAQAIGASVSAPTGVIYCGTSGDFSLSAGSDWQTATPAQRPAPLSPPVVSPNPALAATTAEVSALALGR